jgi:hypothetical protein
MLYCCFTAWGWRRTVFMNVFPRACFTMFTGRCPVMYWDSNSCVNDPTLSVTKDCSVLYPRALLVLVTGCSRSQRSLQTRTQSAAKSRTHQEGFCQDVVCYTGRQKFCSADTHGEQHEVINAGRCDAVHFQLSSGLAQVRAPRSRHT